MNSSSVFCVVFLSVLLAGCSSDELPETEAVPMAVPEFRVIGRDAENIFQYNYSTDPEKAELVNLTRDNNVVPGYITLRQVNETVSFYSFSGGQFSAVLRNVTTGENRLLNAFYTVSPERSITWGTNSENKFFLGYLTPDNTRNFGVRTIDFESGTATDKLYAFNVNRVFEPLYYESRLVLTFRNAVDDFGVLVVDVEEESVLLTLNFGKATPGVLIDENGDIVILVDRGNADFEYAIYDSVSLEFLEGQTFRLNEVFGPGPIPAELIQGRLYFRDQYVQPSPIVFGPGIYNFSDGTETFVDMIRITQEVEAELGTGIALTDIDFDAQSGLFLVSYGTLTATGGVEGGVMAVSEKGTLLENIRLPFIPTNILD